MTHDTRPTTRRAYIGLCVATCATLLTGQAVASTETDYEWEDGHDDIQREYDEEEVRTYLPRFDISREARERLLGVYAWIARSPDHETDAYSYWLRYSHQDPASEDLGLLDRALGALASDAHLWDHEPATVFVDPDSGEVDRVVVTGYHHYPLETEGTVAPITADHTADETHLELDIVDPWHHYRFNEDKDGADITNTVDLESFIAVRDTWEDRGVFDRSSRLAVDNPWAIADGRVDSWWAEGSRDARAARIWHLLGLRGADRTDPSFGSL